MHRRTLFRSDFLTVKSMGRATTSLDKATKQTHFEYFLTFIFSVYFRKVTLYNFF